MCPSHHCRIDFRLLSIAPRFEWGTLGGIYQKLGVVWMMHCHPRRAHLISLVSLWRPMFRKFSFSLRPFSSCNFCRLCSFYRLCKFVVAPVTGPPVSFCRGFRPGHYRTGGCGAPRCYNIFSVLLIQTGVLWSTAADFHSF